MIEILMLRALAYEAQGDILSALVALEHALTLAEPEGYVRIFVDERPPMVQLLKALAERGAMPEYSGKLLAAVELEQQEQTGGTRLMPSASRYLADAKG